MYRPCLQKEEQPKEDRHDFIKSQELDYTGSLHDYILALLRKNKPTGREKSIPQAVLLYGYPGQGKTSFCKKR
jgi:SpoVK/Ycf46/Vps4 family AAA+-type ATPase